MVFYNRMCQVPIHSINELIILCLVSAQAVTNFVMYKFGSLKQAEWQTMYDLAKMFLYCFNHWKLETPAIHVRSSPTDDQRAYKENHARYYVIYMYYVYFDCGISFCL